MGAGSDLLVLELGAVVLVLAVVARLARRVGLPALPMYLLVGLALGEGGLVELPTSASFIEVGAEIGVILMLLMLGLEFSPHELVVNVRRSTLAGLADLALNFTPGLVAGFLLGFDPIVAVLLGGVTYISSSGIVAKLVADLDRIGNHETPVVLSVLDGPLVPGPTRHLLAVLQFGLFGMGQSLVLAYTVVCRSMLCSNLGHRHLSYLQKHHLVHFQTQ